MIFLFFSNFLLHTCRVDCGIVVCYIIKHFFENENLPDSVTKTDMLKMRAELLQCLVSHPIMSWTLEKEKELKALKNIADN